MNHKVTILLCSFCFCLKLLPAQEHANVHLKFIGVETGIFFVSGNITNMDYIRADMPSFPYENSNHNLTSQMDKFHFGVKSEYFSLNDKWGFSSGLRYVQTNSSVGKSGYWRGGTNYFYVLTKSDGIYTEYLKVKEINQSSRYIGVPLEVRFFPTQPHIMRLYLKLGAEVGYLIQSHTDVVFDNELMDSYQSEVTSIVAKPDGLSTSMYGAIGFRIGKETKPLVSIELCLPVLFVAPQSPGLISPVTGGGFQLNVQIPIKSKMQ
jgi:hypothetical protein